ncbi:MAG: cell division protein FtsQ/DivIB [Parvibaculaceae bacterium]|nr:cell division protein FtsQ/DivIB [Parvibaculaceae bacterium]
MRPLTGSKKPARKRVPAKKRGAKMGSKTRVSKKGGPMVIHQRNWFSRFFMGFRPVRQLVEAIRQPTPMTMVAMALIVVAAVYGLVRGGHVEAFADGVTNEANAALGFAGFRIDEVTVQGRKYTDPEALIAALGVNEGDPIFALDTQQARLRLEGIESIQQATVRRMLPDRVHIDLVERTPFAIWQNGGKLTVIDRDGHRITDKNLQAFAGLPFIVGEGAPTHASAIFDSVKSEPALYARVRAYVRVGDRRWNLRLDNGVDIKLPEVGFEKTVQEIVTLDEKYRILTRDIESVDLRLPDEITVRLTPEAMARRDAGLDSNDSRSGKSVKKGALKKLQIDSTRPSRRAALEPDKDGRAVAPMGPQGGEG